MILVPRLLWELPTAVQGTRYITPPVRPPFTPQQRLNIYRKSIKVRGAPLEGNRRETGDTEEREGDLEHTMDEAASTTDGLGFVDPSCTIVHVVRFFLSLPSIHYVLVPICL